MQILLLFVVDLRPRATMEECKRGGVKVAVNGTRATKVYHAPGNGRVTSRAIPSHFASAAEFLAMATNGLNLLLTLAFTSITRTIWQQPKSLLAMHRGQDQWIDHAFIGRWAADLVGGDDGMLLIMYDSDCELSQPSRRSSSLRSVCNRRIYSLVLRTSTAVLNCDFISVCLSKTGGKPV